MNNDNKISRRKALGGIGAVLATTIVNPAFAGRLDSNDLSPDALPEDPTTKYVRPPFSEQQQPWPGLAGKMNPKPDHGEKKLQRFRTS